MFNFGHGAVGVAAAFLFHSLHVQVGLPWPLAAGTAVFLFGTAAGLLLDDYPQLDNSGAATTGWVSGLVAEHIFGMLGSAAPTSWSGAPLL